MEIWKDIKGYEGIYQVSNLGNVKSLERKESYCLNGKKIIRKREEKILSKCVDNQGYVIVALSLKRKIKYFKVHRLVATYFVDNPKNNDVVNHIDCNKVNNNANNLEWCTTKDNINHAFKNNLIKHYTRKIKCIEDNKCFQSIKEASLFYGIQRQNINAVLAKRQKTTFNKTFIYI